MMELIRKKSKGIVMWGIVGLIIASFALFGVESYLSGARNPAPAVVNDVEISSSQLTRAVQTRKQQLQQQLGSSYQPDLFPADLIRQQVLNDLISRQLIAEFTVNADMTAAPKQVLDTIKTVPQFKDATGNFSADIYARAIKGAGRNKAAFEAEVARDHVLNQLRTGIFNSSFVLPYEVEQMQNLLNQQRKVAYLKFSKSDYKQNAKVSDEDMKKYYDSHLTSYKTEEKVNVEYVELNIDQAATKIEVAPEAITEYYEANLSAYTEKDYPAALIAINHVRSRLDKGEAFEALAKEVSKDFGSAKKGGDLGFISKGEQDEAFDKVAFELNRGQVSKPVKTAFGYHLIKVDEVKGDERRVKHILIQPASKPQALDAALRNKITKDIQLQEAEKTFYEDVEKYSNLAYENPESLEAVASGLGLKINSTGLVTRRGLTGVLLSPQVSSAIYSNQVLNESKNSDVIELKETHMIVVRVKEHQPATQKPFDDVKAEVKAQVMIQQQIDAMRNDVNQAYAKLNAGEKGIDLVATYKNSEWIPGEFVTRRNEKKLNIPAAVLSQAFSLARPSESKLGIAMVNLVDGDQAIVVVSDVKDGARDDKTRGQAIAQQLQQINTNSEYIGFEKYLKDNADITINLTKDSEQDS